MTFTNAIGQPSHHVIFMNFQPLKCLSGILITKQALSGTTNRKDLRKGLHFQGKIRITLRIL